MRREQPATIGVTEDFRFIADASARLASSLDYRETLANVAEMLVERTCDYCLIYLKDDEDVLQRVTGRHRTAEGQESVRQLMQIPISDTDRVLERVMREGRSAVVENVSMHPDAPISDEALRIRQALDPRSYILVPLLAGGNAIGALSCVRTVDSTPYSEDDVWLMEELAMRAAAAIEHSRLYGRALRESERRQRAEARLKRLLDSNIVAVCLSRFSGEVVEANDGFLALTGRTRPEMERGGVNWDSLTPGFELGMSSDAREQLTSTGGCGPIEQHYLRKDGTKVPVIIITTLLDDDAADLLTVVVDISERRRIEDAQRHLSIASKTLGSSLNYPQTLRNLAGVLVPDLADWCAVHVLDDDFPVLVALTHGDPAKVQWAEDVSRRYPIDMTTDTGIPKVLKTGEPEFYSRLTDDMLRASASDDDHFQRMKMLDMAGLIIVPLEARGKVIGTMTLVTSQPGRYTKSELDLAMELGHRAAIAVDHARLFRSVEEQVEERTQELQAVNKELESFAYSVSHDLRAPLRSIMSASMIVLEDYGDKIDEEGKQELKRAAAAAKRMSALIDDLLQYSRLGRREMNRHSVDLSAVAEAVGRELALPPGILHVQPGMQVDADEDLIRVAVTNLIENSWKFTKEEDEPRIEVGQAGETFFVRDNGVGFDETYSEKLFVPFERLHNLQDYPGTGIGLANVKRIIARHGGKIWAEGAVGKGAKFSFTVPNAKA